MSPQGSFRVIPRAEHSISRKSISAGALRVLYRLHESGYQAFLVGGAVRDLLLGGHPKDFDIATNATPEQVRALFRNCRLIGRRFRLAHVVFGREIVEVATFRGSSDDGTGDRHTVDGRLVRDNVYGTLEEDAVRRDFTVNALYYDIADFSVRDSVGGMADLEQRMMRLIGDPELRYREDPVRMLRAARLAAKLDFEIAAETAAPFAVVGSLLSEAPPARLFDESLKLFLGGYGLASFRTLERHGLLQHVFPATARVLAGSNAAPFRRLVEQTLASTDARVREDKPVTPAFLFAAMLWEPVRVTAQALADAGADVASAWTHAVDRVLREQAQRVAIPRRFTITIEEIWSLQPRFTQRTRKRAFKLLEHPRFRAAYDFLVLRAEGSPQLTELATWWTEAQQVDHEERAARLAAVPASADSTPPPAARKRARRRRGKAKPSTSAGSTTHESGD
jgi:poly(A) polymerase